MRLRCPVEPVCKVRPSARRLHLLLRLLLHRERCPANREAALAWLSTAFRPRPDGELPEVSPPTRPTATLECERSRANSRPGARAVLDHPEISQDGRHRTPPTNRRTTSTLSTKSPVASSTNAVNAWSQAQTLVDASPRRGFRPIGPMPGILPLTALDLVLFVMPILSWALRACCDSRSSLDIG